MVTITAISKLSLEVPKSPTTALRSISLAPSGTVALTTFEYIVLKTQLEQLRTNGHISFTDPAGNELVDDGTLAAGDLDAGLTASIGGGAAAAAAVAAATPLDVAGTLMKRSPFSSVSCTTFNGNLAGNVTGDVTGNVSGTAADFTGSLVGDVTGTQGATAIDDAVVTGKLLTGFASGAGAVAATDSILAAAGKLDGNTALKADKPTGVTALGVTVDVGTTDGSGGAGDAALAADVESRLDAIEAKIDALIAALNA